MLTVASLRKALTTDAAYTALLGDFKDAGFKTELWRDNGIARLTTVVVARILSLLSAIVIDLTKQSIVTDASSESVVEIAKSHFDESPLPATRAILRVNLENIGTDPISMASGELTVTDGLTSTVYRATSAISLSVGATAIVDCVADEAGRKDVPLDALSIQVSRAGLRAVGAVESIDIGYDGETASLLASRCTLKWGILSFHTLTDKVNYLIRSSDSRINRVTLDRTPRSGLAFTSTIVIASDGSDIDAPSVAALQAVVDGVSLADGSNVVELAELIPQDQVGTVYYAPGIDPADILRKIEIALTDYYASVPIGGPRIGPGAEGVLLRTELEEVYNAVPEIRAVVLTAPTQVVALGSRQAPSLGIRDLRMVAAFA